MNAITMPWLLQASMTLSSRTEPPGWGHILHAALMGSLNVVAKGKKASEPRATSVSLSSHSLFSSFVNTSASP